ncbi:MAG: KpsF/GutQ family sugar-phosphate isomerase [Kiritimatiellia bacterium]|jgi:arabinose-5-phosphate isomerase
MNTPAPPQNPDRSAWISRAREVMDIEIEGLQSARDALGESFLDAIGLFLEKNLAGGKIVVSGVGKSLHVAEKIAATLASTGSPSVHLNPMQAMHGDLGMVGPNDVLLAISFSGESEELLKVVPAVRRLGVPIVSLAGNPGSTLATCSDVAVTVSVAREACPFNLAPTTSTTATLAVGDAFAMVLMLARGFRREDYARFHPAGAIGRALLTRAGDIMRTGDHLACVEPSASVEQALFAMTHAKAGSACVADASGALRGIFTDGDLRRGLAKSGVGVLKRPVSDFMSADPIRVLDSQMAVDVLRILESHQIDDVPVVDASGKLVGCIDIQDLPRFKIL